MYGRPLSPEEVKPVDGQAHKQVRSNFNNQSMFARYISPNNPFSLVSSMVGTAPSSLASFGAWFQHVGTTLSTLFSPNTMFKPLFATMGHTFADQLQSYSPDAGSQAWGYSQDELTKLANDPSYSLEENEKIIAPKVAQLDSKYGKCFTTPSQYDADQLAKKDDCSADNLKQDDVFRYRIYKGLDTYVVNELTSGLAQ